MGEKLKVLDLFSGIGGFSLGLEATGHFETVAFCEIDGFCQRVLKKHWPHVPVFGDIKQLNREVLGNAGLLPIDVICGGPPCQPISVAGKRRGKEDDRWLWDETIRIVAEVKPCWCLFENPTGIVSMGLDGVLTEMESQGYETGAFIIPACAVGAPHRRDRVWIVANTDSKYGGTSRAGSMEKGTAIEIAPAGKQSEVLANAERNGLERRKPTPGEKADLRRRPVFQSQEDVAATACQLPYGNRQSRRGRPEPANGGQRQFESGVCRVFDGPAPGLDGHRWPAPFGCEQHGWEPPRLATGKIPYRRQRLQALGNAVVPQVVTEIGRAIWEVEICPE